MRLLLGILSAIVLCTVSAPPVVAGVGEERVLALVAAKASELEPLESLREEAADGKAQEQLGLYLHYRTTPRGAAGPALSNAQLVSRQEAEGGLTAAVENGNGLALMVLGAARLYGFSVLKDRQAAQLWLSKAVEVMPRQQRPLARLLLAESREAEADDLDELAEWFPGEAAVLQARMSEPSAALALLVAVLADPPSIVDVDLARKLIGGEGGVSDPTRALALLDGAIRSRMPRAAAEMGRLYVDGKIVPRLPRFGIALMSGWAEVDTDTRQELATLLETYRVSLDNSQFLMLRMAEDAEVGVPGAALTLVRLIEARREGFRNQELLFDLLEEHSDQQPQIALIQAYYFGRWSTRSKTSSQRLAQNARTIIDRAILDGVPGALSLKGLMLSEGLGYEQDHLAATAAYQTGAEMGESASLIGLAEAYQEGIGVPEDGVAELDLLRRASAQGSIEARIRMMWLFKFDAAHKRMTLEEGITDLIALYGDGFGGVSANAVGSLFSNQRLRDFSSDDVIAAFMNGLRLAPGAVIDERLEWLQSSVPRQVWAEVEAVLLEDGYYSGEISGLMVPAARNALRQWALQKRQ